MNRNEPSPILCGTDFSECSRLAANVSAALAKQLSVPLLLVHVSEPLPVEVREAMKAISPPDASGVTLLEEGERLRKLGAVVATRFLTGTADEELIGLAQ